METVDNLFIEKEAYKLLDLLLERAGNFTEFYIKELLVNEINELDDTHGENCGGRLYGRIDKMLEYYGYSEKNKNSNSLMHLTGTGMDAKAAGGHASYVLLLEKQEKDRQQERDFLRTREIAEYDNLIHSTKVNKYLYKTRWIPHLLAVAALGVSIWALVESRKPKAEEPKIETKTIKQSNTVKNTIKSN